jgi:hypothetical protein
MRNQRGGAFVQTAVRSPAKKLPEPDPARNPCEQASQPSPRRSKTVLYVKKGGELKKLERCSAV